MRRLTYSFAAATALTAVSIVTAFAHASLERPEATAGGYKAVLRIPHGCDGQPTHTVKVVLPEGFVAAKPMPKAGWTLAIETGDYARTYSLHGRDVSAGARTITWSGGDLADDFYDEFVVTGTLDAEAGSRLPFLVTQVCAGGQVTWDQIAADGVDPHSLEFPAPLVTVAAAADDHAHAHHAAATDAAGSATVGDLSISSGWARAMLPGQPAGGGYLTIANAGAADDRLVSASSPASGKAEIHSMEMAGDVMKMRKVDDGIVVPAGGSVELKPGGLHLMFMQVAEPFAEGASVPLTLTFEKAGDVQVTLPVRKAAGGDGGHKH